MTELIHPDAAQALTLPARYYLDSAIAPLEKENIFACSWQIVGHTSQIPNPGSFFTADLAGEPLLIVRNSGGGVKGFYNVCRHRAGPPAEGCGERKVFRCGYHGWTYSLDGALLNAPECEGVANFRHEDFALVPVRVEIWSGLIFVNLDVSARPLLESLGQLPKQMARFRLDAMQLHQRRVYPMQCNWKTYIDNYLEGYHLPSVHPGLNRELDYSSYITQLFSNYSLQSSPIRGAENEKTVQRRYSQAHGDDVAEYYWVFPNWMLNCYPDNVSVNIVLPTSAETSIAIFEWYFPADMLSTAAPEQTVKFSDEIQIEDVRICEVVQKNLRSRSYSRGRYSVKQERGLHHFHRLYAQAMGL
ncbi:MAG TPA: aromatic ring-hydroxylating dioxygenase subunit alpha [Alphaproteobacteria bacterium]|nr:aromatic ring-hydroxylating dioxygenase subunit alpha [Alphaproteobacteria bacterium]